MNWHIGQEVVCIESAKGTNPTREGEIYTIRGIKKDQCKDCGGILLDFGFKATNPFGELLKCPYHHSNIYKCDGILWSFERRFRALDELCNIDELKEVLTNTKPFEILKP